MIFHGHMFRKVTIIGVGLMGGSLGMALKKHKLAREVVGVANRHETLDEAIKKGAIDCGFTDAAKGVQNADLVVLATPVDTIARLLPVINPHLRRGCLVTDMGSTKSEIAEKAGSALSAPALFVGSHPLAGSERKGVAHAQADLFEGSTCVMTPTSKTSQVAREKIKHLWSRLGAKVVFLSPEDHDKTLAQVSHLPHLLAFALIQSVADEYLGYASQGLKDSTRIAASSPQMWNDIFLANSRNVINSLDDLVKNLALLRKTILNRDQKTLTQFFAKAKEKRDKI